MLKSAILKSYSGKNKNAFLLSPNAPYYDSELGIWMNTNVLAEQIQRRSVHDYQVIDTLVEQKNEIFKLGEQPVHHLFLTTIAVEIYQFAKAKGASPLGALIVLAQASLESGYGADALKNKDYNLFGVMGSPSKRKTTHGSVKDYSNIGGYKASITDYFNRIDSKWHYFITVIKQTSITADDIDKGLNTGTHYPTKKENHDGKYTYNSDMGKDGKNHYGEIILKQVAYFKKRFISSLEYQIKQNKNEIGKANNSVEFVNPFLYNGNDTYIFDFRIKTLQEQNKLFETILNEIN